MPKASFSPGHISLSTKKPKRPIIPHCSSIPIWAKDHIGPSFFTTCLNGILGDEKGNAAKTRAIKTAEYVPRLPESGSQPAPLGPNPSPRRPAIRLGGIKSFCMILIFTLKNFAMRMRIEIIPKSVKSDQGVKVERSNILICFY